MPTADPPEYKIVSINGTSSVNTNQWWIPQQYGSPSQFSSYPCLPQNPLGSGGSPPPTYQLTDPCINGHWVTWDSDPLVCTRCFSPVYIDTSVLTIVAEKLLDRVKDACVRSLTDGEINVGELAALSSEAKEVERLLGQVKGLMRATAKALELD